MDRNALQVGRAVTINVSLLVGGWLLAAALIRLSRLVSSQWAFSPGSIIVAACIGVAVSRRFRARLAQVVFLTVVAVMTAELGAHAVFGIRAVQGFETHLTVLAAGSLGVLFGFMASAFPPGGREAGYRVQSLPEQNSLAA